MWGPRVLGNPGAREPNPGAQDPWASPGPWDPGANPGGVQAGGVDPCDVNAGGVRCLLSVNVGAQGPWDPGAQGPMGPWAQEPLGLMRKPA